MQKESELDNVLIETMDETQILSSLLWVSELMMSTTELDEVLRLIVELTPKLVNLNRCTIFLWDEDAGSFIPKLSHSPGSDEHDGRLAKFYAMRLNQEEIPVLTRKLREENVPVVIKDTEGSAVLPTKYIDMFEIKSMIVLPLLCRGEFIGAMSLDHTKDIHHFSPKEIKVAMGLATHAALAIRNAQLIHELREERNRSERLLDTMAEGLMVLSPERKIMATNSALERITGMAGEDMRGMLCREIFDGGYSKGSVNRCERSCPMTHPSTDMATVEGTVTTRNHRKVSLSSNYSSAFGLDGRLLYTVVTIREVNDRKRPEDAAIRHSDQLIRHRELPGSAEEAQKGGF